MPQPTISDADMDAAIGATPLSDNDLRERSQALSDAQDLWEKAAYLSIEKIPCRECGGSGRVSGGTFGDMCVACEGTRVEEAPDAEEFPMPPFASMRAAITEYGNALADRDLPEGHVAKKHLALPAPSTVPDLDAIKAVHAQGKEKVKELRAAQGRSQLGAGRGVDPRSLPEGKPDSGFEGDGNLGDVEDAELDEMEDNAKNPRADGPRGKR